MEVGEVGGEDAGLPRTRLRLPEGDAGAPVLDVVARVEAAVPRRPVAQEVGGAGRARLTHGNPLGPDRGKALSRTRRGGSPRVQPPHKPQDPSRPPESLDEPRPVQGDPYTLVIYIFLLKEVYR